MTLITAALDRIARQVSITPPANWITASAAEYVEIRDDFLPETVEEITDRLDLVQPVSKIFDVPCDGSEAYDLPTDFKRVQRDQMAVYETLNNRRALLPVTDDGVWTHLQVTGTAGVSRYYRLTGYDENWSISILRAPSTGQVIKVHYVTKNWMANAAGTQGDAFTDATDILILPRRVVETGTIARWRARKGLPYDAQMMEFEAELNRLDNDSRNRRIVSFTGDNPEIGPWDIPVPDFIPSS